MAECLEMIWVESGPVPCGRCAYCTQKRRNEWMFRVKQEMRYQEHPGYFLTLTYNERMVKRVEHGLSLRFRDVQLMLKRIRKAGYYCKYICVGEYGSKTQRPHYHMILWTDLKPERFEEFWYRMRFGRQRLHLGHIHVGVVNEKSILYCLKYIIEQQKMSEFDDREKPRAQFSRGIGIQYMTWPIWEYHTDESNPKFLAVVDGREVALPRYYKKYMFTKWQLKEERKRLVAELQEEKQREIARLRGVGYHEPE